MSGKGYIVKLTAVLFLITAITAALLGFVNGITADKIAAITAQKTQSAMSEVSPNADSFEKLEYTGSEALVSELYEAKKGAETVGYVVRVSPSGFGGKIDMVVGVGKDGKVTGVSIVRMSETSGLGANASKQSFREQYEGADGSVALKKDGGSIDALTGATVTSRAVTSGVNAALAAAQTAIREG